MSEAQATPAFAFATRISFRPILKKKFNVKARQNLKKKPNKQYKKNLLIVVAFTLCIFPISGLVKLRIFFNFRVISHNVHVCGVWVQPVTRQKFLPSNSNGRSFPSKRRN